MTPRHHAIVYAGSPPESNKTTAIEAFKNGTAGNPFRSLGAATNRSITLFEQCNGPIASLNSNMNILVIIPTNYINNEEELISWIDVCNEMGFTLEYHGKMDLNKIPKSQYTGDISVPEYLKMHYTTTSFSEGYVVYVNSPEFKFRGDTAKNQYKLACLSLLRTLYIPYYKEIINELEILRAIPENKDMTLFQLFTFAFYTFNNSQYTRNCNGNYNFVQVFGILKETPHTIQNLKNVWFNTFEEFLAILDDTHRINGCTQRYKSKPLVSFNSIQSSKENQANPLWKTISDNLQQAIKTKNLPMMLENLNKLYNA